MKKQFRILAAFCAASLALNVLGGIALAQTEEAAVKRFRETGGRILQEEHGTVRAVYIGARSEDVLKKVDLSGFPKLDCVAIGGYGLTDRSISCVQRLPPGLVQLIFVDAAIGDDGMVPLLEKQRASLRALNLSGTRVTDKTLAAVAKLKAITSLNVSRTKVTDKGLKKLRKVNWLRELSLDDTRVTDEGMNELAHQKKLVSLSLCNTKTTDEGLKVLTGHENLVFLYLTGTNVTDDAKRGLQGTLPNIQLIE